MTHVTPVDPAECLIKSDYLIRFGESPRLRTPCRIENTDRRGSGDAHGRSVPKRPFTASDGDLAGSRRERSHRPGQRRSCSTRELIAGALDWRLAESYHRIYGDQEPRIADALDEAAWLVIERIASSDAPHSRLRTHCSGHPLRPGHLRGRRVERTITPSAWAILSWLR